MREAPSDFDDGGDYSAHSGVFFRGNRRFTRAAATIRASIFRGDG